MAQSTISKIDSVIYDSPKTQFFKQSIKLTNNSELIDKCPDVPKRTRKRLTNAFASAKDFQQLVLHFLKT